MTLFHPRAARRAALLLVGIAAASPLAAQIPAPSTDTHVDARTGELSGRVRSASNGAPLGDVMLRVAGTTRGAITDADGRFRIGAVAAGPRLLIAQRMGYATHRDSVIVPAGGTLAVDVTLAEQASVLAPTIVSATREIQRRAEASATIDVLDGAELRHARPSHPADVMNRLAGVHVSVLSGEGHSMAIRQPITTKPMYLYLEDGIPTRATGFFNHNALYEINIPQSAGIEVLKGPGTALYGSDAIAGVINVLTRPAPATPGAELSLEGGAYGYGRLLASGGFTRGRNGVRTDLNLTRNDGWRDGSAYERQSGTVRWDHFRVSGLTARTVLTASNIDQNDVPALSLTQFQSRPELNRAPIAFREVQAVRLSSAVELERGPALWSVTPYARHDVLELVPSWQLSYDPQWWDTRNRSLGVLAKYRRDFTPLRARLIVGTDVDFSPGSFTARRAVTSAAGDDRIFASYTAGELQYDYDVTYRSVSPYAHVELSPTSRLRLDAGLRYDHAGYDYTNDMTVLETGSHRRPASTDVRYDHLSPKVGATYELAPSASLFASYRHGFRAPSQGQLFQQNSAANTVDLAPVKVDSYEAGVRGQVGPRLVYQISAYDMTIRDDILTFVTAQNTREATNAGRTRHKGVEGSAGLALTPRLRLDGSYSMSSQRYVSWRPQEGQPAADGRPARAAVDYSGNRIEQAPRDLGSLMLTWTPAALGDGRMVVEWRRTGRYAEDAANTPGQEYGGYDLLNAQVDARLRSGITVFARAVNLLDRRYAELASYDPFQKEQLTPGTPRSVFAGVKAEVGR
ncbi:MAG: TonB-dependent receptor [Gemmatimonadaceae bacterium]